MCAQGDKCQTPHRYEERKKQETAPGSWPEHDHRSSTATVVFWRESHRTLEMRGCRQDRQSSQEDTSWWDSTSTRLR